MTNRITRRQFTAGAVATAAASVGLTRAQAQNFGGDELIEAAKKEGKMVYYTANFTEVEQEVIKAFNKRFPFVRVQLVRAPGGQLITRVRTEAAAGKLAADVVDHSDRGLMLELQDLFQDYAPPNGSDYLPDARVSPKLWPRITSVWVIAYNTELAKNPPKSWKDLTKPEYGPKMIGTVIAPSGGTTWTRVMYERQVLGEDYWKKLAATQPVLFPSGAPLSDALIRGEVTIAQVQFNIAFPKKRDGAPIGINFPPEGTPVTPFATGVAKTTVNPNAAKLFLNWCFSEEGQLYMSKEQGSVSAMKKAPYYPEGFDPKAARLWLPNFEQYEKLRASWVEEWNKTFGYRQ